MPHRRYLSNNINSLQTVPDPRSQLLKSLTTTVTGCPPQPAFHPKQSGLFSGPTSLAYLFLWLSRTHPGLVVKGKLPGEWCRAYLSCSRASYPNTTGPRTGGIHDEYLAYHAVQASATNDLAYAETLRQGVETLHADPAENEFLYGRAGTLALLRLVKHWVPSAAATMTAAMALLIAHILAHQPWQWHGSDYIGAVHGDIGIITQLVLSSPSSAPALTARLSQLLDLQTPTGNWPACAGAASDVADLVQFCHGAPGFIVSLLAIRAHFPVAMQTRIDAAVARGRTCVWERGLLRKEPNLCHGIVGNALALDDGAGRRSHFMAFTTGEAIARGLAEGWFLRGDDRWGVWWGEGGRAWVWALLDGGGRGQGMEGMIGYSDV